MYFRDMWFHNALATDKSVHWFSNMQRF